MSSSLNQILDDFAYLDEWEDRYRYVIDLGKQLPDLPEEERTRENKVEGCASQVWLVSEVGDGADPVLTFRGDSDAHIVRGLIAVLLRLFSGKQAAEILASDAKAAFDKLGLSGHLSAQRSNGLASMVGRVRRDAEALTAA